ncbi:MAG: hypothetical protein CL992_03365 [Euryarchaeota archaeon]|nr:hypothetical protein [Euryarchaeota archaeon]
MTEEGLVRDEDSKSDDTRTVETIIAEMRAEVAEHPDDVSLRWSFIQVLVAEKNPKTLANVSLAMSQCRAIIERDQEHVDAWLTGGYLLTHYLGILDEALEWWQKMREQIPEHPLAILQQASILADLGMYDDAAIQIDRLMDEGVRSLGRHQIHDAFRLRETVQHALASQDRKWFKPWIKSDEGWDTIRVAMMRGPPNASRMFLFTVAPFMWLEAWLITTQDTLTFTTMLFGMAIILLTFIYGRRLTNRMTRRLSIPSLNLLRAMEIETTTGKMVIETDIRSSKLYDKIMQKRPLSILERTEKIVKRDKRLEPGWEFHIPDLDSADDALRRYVDRLDAEEMQEGFMSLAEFEEE